jgi:NAD-dependent dihydropyrimidine dehydrogenase PreA subunit
MKNMTTTKRCRGWRFEGHEGQEPHMLPMTLEYFHTSRYTNDGFNYQCKACASAYGSYRLGVDRERREARKAELAKQGVPATIAEKRCKVCMRFKPRDANHFPRKTGRQAQGRMYPRYESTCIECEKAGAAVSQSAQVQS